MNRYLRVLKVGLLFAASLSAGAVQADMSSASFSIAHEVMGGGGGNPQASTDFMVFGTTAGQPSPIGDSFGTVLSDATGGYWPKLLGADGDSIASAVDNCPTLFNRDQADGDGDAVGDVCDNCVATPNPRVAADFLSGHPWASLTGGQRDDDGDGIGNICDADFNESGLTLRINAADTAAYKASVGHHLSDFDCGTDGASRCSVYDLNEDANLGINAADTARYKDLLGFFPGPTCPTCPLACQSGPQGVCP